MGISDLCTTFVNTAKLKDDAEKNIIEFSEAPWGLGLGTSEGVPPLFPVQKFIFKCAYNIPLDDSQKTIIIRDRFNEKDRFIFTEIEYINFLFNEGRINVKEITGDPNDFRPNLHLVIGRRGLKTSSIAVLVAFETYRLLKKYSPQEYYKIMPDDEIRISCIATNMEQASELFRRITGHLERADCFRLYRNKPTLSYMQLSSQRDLEKYKGMRPSIRLVAAPCSGRGIRGHNNIIAVMDEMAYFFESDTSTDKSDANIYDSVTPSTIKFAPHGRIICISSPAARSGKFYDLYQRSMEVECNDWLMIQAPSWEVDHTLSSKILRSKFSENPTTYIAEYGAQFSDRVSAWIENEQVLRINIIPGLRLKDHSYERLPHFMGIDVGLRGDGSAIAVVHLTRREVDGVLKDLIELDHVEVRYNWEEHKEYFQPEEIANWIASYKDKFLIVKGVMDQYYGLSMIPVLQEAGMKQVEIAQMTRELNSKIYQNLMSQMLNASLRIPEGNEVIIDGRKTTDIPLVTEMLKLQATIHSKYLISVEAPQVKGIHDDCSDAYARAVYLATEYLSQGGGVSRQNVAGAVGSTTPTYRQYYMKQKKVSSYTNRPSTSLQLSTSQSRFSSSMNSLPNRFGR